jgi:spore germination protein KC
MGRVSKTRSSWMHAARVANSPDEGGKAVELAGVGVFRDDKLVVWLDAREAQALFWLLHNPRESVISSPCPDDPSQTFSVEVNQGRSNPIAQLSGNQISFLVMATARVNLMRSACGLSLVEPANRRRLEIQLERDLAGRLDDAIRAMQSGKADPTNFGRRVQRAYPALWRRIQEEWPDIWARTPVTYHVTAAIHHSGLLIDPINRTRGEVPMETP